MSSSRRSAAGFLEAQSIIEILRRSQTFRDAVSRLGGSTPLHLQGLVTPARSAFAEALRAETGRQVVVLCAGEEDVDRSFARLTLFAGGTQWRRIGHATCRRQSRQRGAYL